MSLQQTDRYDDIINLPHHRSCTRPHMSMHNPCRAIHAFRRSHRLRGCHPGNRTADRYKSGDWEEVREELDRKQQYLQDIIADRPEITITYFVPDERKAGGSYTSHTGSLKRIDYYERVFVLTDGTKIPLDEIADIESECFRGIL